MSYIEREKVLAEYDRQHKGPPGGARKIIAEFPAADVRPVVHSFWVYNPGDNFPYCDNCGMPQDARSDFCHSCGADMRQTFVSEAKEES